MPDSFRIGTVILFVLCAGIVHRTIHAKFVLLGPPYFGQKLRPPLLSPSGQTQARRCVCGGGGGVVQQVDSSRDASLHLLEGNEVSVVGNLSVASVEVSSSQALTTGSNLGAYSHESSTFGNGNGNSSEPSCLRLLTLVQAPLGQDPPDLHRRIRPFDTTTGYMVPAIARDGPITPGQGFREHTVRLQGAALIVLPRAVDLFLDLDRVLALSVAMARVIGEAIAAAPDGTVALV